ncbi:unnamed protein product [Boreogadus saida]
MPRFTYQGMILSELIVPPEKEVVSYSTSLINWSPAISNALPCNTKDLFKFVIGYAAAVEDGYDVMLMGDFNLPNIDWSTSMIKSGSPQATIDEAEELLDLMDSHFMDQHVIEDDPAYQPILTTKEFERNSFRSLNLEKADWEAINHNLSDMDWVSLKASCHDENYFPELFRLMLLQSQPHCPRVEENLKTELALLHIQMRDTIHGELELKEQKASPKKMSSKLLMRSTRMPPAAQMKILLGWYFGKLSRKEAERQLLSTGNLRGTYLIRESETSPGTHIVVYRW